MARRLIFVRHAESENNVRGVVNGDVSIDYALTDNGRRQAEDLRDALVSERVDVCVTSAFARTRETARIALVGLDIPLEIDAALGDPPLGVLESKPAGSYLTWLAEHDWSLGPDGGGESQLASIRRYVDAFDRLTRRPEETVLVVGHAFPIGVATTLASGDPPAVRRHYDCDFDHARPIEVDPEALRAGIERARRELVTIQATT